MRGSSRREGDVRDGDPARRNYGLAAPTSRSTGSACPGDRNVAIGVLHLCSLFATAKGAVMVTVLDVTCPACGAPPGERCVPRLLTGGNHRSREAARQAEVRRRLGIAAVAPKGSK